MRRLDTEEWTDCRRFFGRQVEIDIDRGAQQQPRIVDAVDRSRSTSKSRVEAPRRKVGFPTLRLVLFVWQ
jgi:hypothetical protein